MRISDRSSFGRFRQMPWPVSPRPRPFPPNTRRISTPCSMRRVKSAPAVTPICAYILEWTWEQAPPRPWRVCHWNPTNPACPFPPRNTVVATDIQRFGKRCRGCGTDGARRGSVSGDRRRYCPASWPESIVCRVGVELSRQRDRQSVSAFGDSACTSRYWWQLQAEACFQGRRVGQHRSGLVSVDK